MASLSRPVPSSITCIANALIIYTLAKDVEGGGGDRILYIVDYIPCFLYKYLRLFHCEFRTGVPWELLYADDLAVIADTLKECIDKLKAWKNGMENRGLRVNMKKTKFMI